MTTIPLDCRLPKTYRIKEIVQETANVRSFTLDGSLGAKPGQFVMVWLPGVDENPMSVAYDDGETTKITFFAVGDFTNALAEKKVGDLVGLRGPFGTHYTWKKGQHLALVAGGYGAAPMYFAAQHAVKDGCTIDMIVGARSTEHLLYIDQFKKMKNVTLHVATDDGSMGHKGYNAEVLEQLLAKKDHGIDQIFACGPELMLKRISEISAEHNVASQLSLERFMKCGYGLCGNCTVDPLGIRLCTDGPVVKNDVCLAITEFGQYHRDDLGKKHAFLSKK
jgi:dihydroorotate dehydrogenase electron transfer subunit